MISKKCTVCGAENVRSTVKNRCNTCVMFEHTFGTYPNNVYSRKKKYFFVGETSLLNRNIKHLRSISAKYSYYEQWDDIRRYKKVSIKDAITLFITGVLK